MLHSNVVHFRQGVIEYARAGSGPVILIAHGTLGGFDQGLAIAQLFNEEKFSFVAVSRAGYLRSSANTGRTPLEQARSFAALLEHLDIQSAAMMGVSGGAPSAIAFAELFPEKCWALILISSITIAPPPLPLFFRFAVRFQSLMLRFDPLWALVHRFGLSALMRANGVTAKQVARIMADPLLLEVARGVFQPIKSASLRRLGVRLDDEQINDLPAAHWFQCQLPTLLTHAANDPLAPVSAARQLADTNPNVDYHEFDNGGHLFFLVHEQQFVPTVEQFLQAHAPDFDGGQQLPQSEGGSNV